MQHIRLTPLTEAERGRFVEEEVANYADQQVRDAGWPRHEALGRARAEFMPALDHELDEARAQGHQLWTAARSDGESVGWLWVKPTDDVQGRKAFLYQITVAATHRRQGYGRAMLAALEETLARGGIEELHLNVNIANEPARRLYAAAGYEQVGEDERICRLRKRLGRPPW
jgi:ribosomal protein S18 acetylase RimI-like enzyme